MACPALSVIAGKQKDIDRAIILRKILGGGMRQTGILCAAALESLNDWEEVLTEDNANCKWMAEELADCKGLIYDPSTIETNIFSFKIDKEHQKRVNIDHHTVRDKLNEDHSILLNSGMYNDMLRFVTHRGVDREHCERAVKGIKQLLNKW